MCDRRTSSSCWRCRAHQMASRLPQVCGAWMCVPKGGSVWGDDGGWLVPFALAGSDDNTSVIWDIRQRRIQYTILAHSGLVSNVRWVLPGFCAPGLCRWHGVPVHATPCFAMWAPRHGVPFLGQVFAYIGRVPHDVLVRWHGQVVEQQRLEQTHRVPSPRDEDN